MKMCAIPLLLVMCPASTPLLSAEPLALRGDFSAHDPSTIAKDRDTYWVFATGQGIRSRRSKDLVTWEAGPNVFTNPPGWTTNAVPGFNGTFWAPDVIHPGDLYLLYYSVSTWGSQTSAIGLATSHALNPDDPRYGWTDRGIVIQSNPSNDFNTIDPSVMLDSSGKLWLAFGSYWSGIKLIQLDPKTGHRLTATSPIYALAWNKSIEASCLYQQGGFYFLFVNWGQCCRGVESTYNIRVGRSTEITGPYFDKAGTNMLQGGGTLFLGSEGRHIGPGHAGFVTQNGTNWLSFHYYDGERQGARTLGLRRIRWNKDGWPEVE